MDTNDFIKNIQEFEDMFAQYESYDYQQNTSEPEKNNDPEVRYF